MEKNTKLVQLFQRANTCIIVFFGTSIFEDHGELGIRPTREGHVGSSVNSNQSKGFDVSV